MHDFPSWRQQYLEEAHMRYTELGQLPTPVDTNLSKYTITIHDSVQDEFQSDQIDTSYKDRGR